jgi:hypothetical protein
MTWLRAMALPMVMKKPTRSASRAWSVKLQPKVRLLLAMKRQT